MTQKLELKLKLHERQHLVLDDNARYKVLVAGRRFGKTYSAINALYRNALLHEGSLSWYCAPTYRQAKMIAWELIKKIICPEAIIKANESELSVVIKNGSKLELKGADNEDSLRGVGLNFVVMDEVAQMKENVWYEIIRPMLIDTHGSALFIGTPKGRNLLYNLYNKGKQGLDGFKSWRFKSEDSPYVTIKEINTVRGETPEDYFRQEYLAEFLEGSGSIFKGIMKCAIGELKEPTKSRDYVLAADLAKMQDFTVLMVADIADRAIVEFQRFNEISWSFQKQKIATLAKKYNNAKVILDSTGVGSPIEDDLRYAGLNVEGYKFTNASKKELIQQLQIAIENRQIIFPNIPELIQELEAYEYTLTPAGNVKMGAPSGLHDDCVISLALAVYGFKSSLYYGVSDERKRLRQWKSPLERPNASYV